MKKIAIIGVGKIGKEVEKRALALGWQVPVLVRSSGIFSAQGEKIDVPGNLGNLANQLKSFQIDAAVLTIPTHDQGETALGYIQFIAGTGIPVVSSEKGALGNFFPELESIIKAGMIGYSATVGGGTRLLHWLKHRVNSEISEIHLVINGTLNYVLDGLSHGRVLDELIWEAKLLGYAEPGAQLQPIDILNAEICRDVPMKTSVLINICGLGSIRTKNIQVEPLSGVTLRQLVREAASRRYIVSLCREPNEDGNFAGFEFRLGDWFVTGGFKNRSHNPLFLQLVPPGVNNAALIHGQDGTYILTGPGAGPGPTASAIINDLKECATT